MMKNWEEDNIKLHEALCDMYDIERQANFEKWFAKLPKDNEGTETTIMDCIQNVIIILEKLVENE